VNVKYGMGYNLLDTLHYMKASLEEMIDTYANRKQNDDGKWDKSKDKLTNLK
jgi:hypothetical protein